MPAARLGSSADRAAASIWLITSALVGQSAYRPSTSVSTTSFSALSPTASAADVADLADVDRFAVDDGRPSLGGQQPTVLAGQPDRERAVVVDQVDDVAVDLAGEHHPDDGHRLGGRDAQAAPELAGDAELAQVFGDLRAAAVHHHGLQPGVAEEDDVLGERLLQLGRGHGVAAVLDHHDLAVEALQPGQRVDQDGRLLVRVHDE
jgi:hypothetical protein